MIERRARRRARLAAGVEGLEGRSLPSAVGTPGDFDGDGRTDLALFDRNTQALIVAESGGGPAIIQSFGDPRDRMLPVMGDFEGNGKTDVGVYDLDTATFHITLSDGTHIDSVLGDPSHINVPVFGDYDGDGKTDVGVYDQTTATFYIRESSTPGGVLVRQLGDPSHVNVPLAGDFDGDGQTDLAVFDQDTDTFEVISSRTVARSDFTWGFPSHSYIPVVGDYDGDGTTDFALYDRTLNEFFIQYSNRGHPFLLLWPLSNFGVGLSPTDAYVPISGDFDGDGLTDIGVFDVSTATFVYNKSSRGVVVQQFGAASHENVPIPTTLTGDPYLFSPVQYYEALHQNFLARSVVAPVSADVIFLGDSITRYFGEGSSTSPPFKTPTEQFLPDLTGPGIEPGRPALWAQQIAPLRAFNFGIPGDTTDDVLWRVQSELDPAVQHPRAVVLLVGINDLLEATAEKTTDLAYRRIEAIVRQIHVQAPGAAVILMDLLPTGDPETYPHLPPDLRERVNDLNARINDPRAFGGSVSLLDLRPSLALPVFPGYANPAFYGLGDPTDPKNPFAGDGVHPFSAAYRVWTSAILARLRALGIAP